MRRSRVRWNEQSYSSGPVIVFLFSGLSWLNDEVINFYMQLICERSEQHDNWPKVYAFNTFFYPKIVTTGQASVKR